MGVGHFRAGNPEETVVSCTGCGAPDLYIQKDFNRKLALAIVGIGCVLSFWTYGLSLLVVALIDWLLYRRVSWMTVCYRCRAAYRGFRLNPSHREFDRHTEELYRYG